MDAEMRERLSLAGLTGSDLDWLESFGCDDARVPKPLASEIAEYRRREAALNASVAALTFAERGQSSEGRLAAAIGAKVADAEDEAQGTGGED
jgi:hypothetical protein